MWSWVALSGFQRKEPTWDGAGCLFPASQTVSCTGASSRACSAKGVNLLVLVSFFVLHYYAANLTFLF